VKPKVRINHRRFTLSFQVNDRWYEVEATDATLQDLCMGPHVRQKAIQAACDRLKDPSLDMVEVEEIMNMDMRPPQAHGELKGVRLRWPRRVHEVAPFTLGNAA
jgi:hypothetical protein